MSGQKGVKKGTWLVTGNKEHRILAQYHYYGNDSSYYVRITEFEPDVFSILVTHTKSAKVNWKYHSVSISLSSAKHLSHGAIRRHKRSKERKK